MYSRVAERNSSVTIPTRYGLDGPRIESRSGARFSVSVQTGTGAQPASCTMGTGSFLGVKRPGRGVDHPPHLAPRLKSTAIPLLPLWASVACYRVNFVKPFILSYAQISDQTSDVTHICAT